MAFIRGARRAQELKQLDGEIFALYDTLSHAAVKEQAARVQKRP